MYEMLLQELIEDARRDNEILGMLLTGSVARGDAHPGSDLDLRYILSPGLCRPFQSELRQGILVERGYADLARAQEKLAINPMEVYAYLDGRILYDPDSVLAQLKAQAQQAFATYQPPTKELQAITYWLMSARLKIEAALAAGDLLKAAYITSTTSWKILEGLWAVNNRPIPPSGALLVHVKDLTQGPPQVEEALQTLFCGDTQQRIQTALDLIGWVLTC